MPSATSNGIEIAYEESGEPGGPTLLLVQTLRRKLRLKVRAPYQLMDMMRDTAGLLDALRIESAHVVGVSMGGMISQLLAIHEPRCVKSLTSIMSTTGNRKLPGPSRKVTRHVMRGPQGRTDEARLEYHWKLWRLIGSPGYPTLVIHGDSDPMVPVECGLDTARAIPGARTEIIEGMGHDLPVALTDRLVKLITRHVRES